MKTASKNHQHKKILFRLEKDEEGYPPDDWESVWALEIEPGLFSIDNIPFFIRGLSWGDIVSAERVRREWHFKQLERQSDHSVLRVIVYDQTEVAQLRETLQKMNCDTENSHIPGLVAVDVPPTTSLDEIIEFLQIGASQERWDYEEASIRHPQSSDPT